MVCLVCFGGKCDRSSFDSKTRACDVSLLPRLLVNQLGFEEKTGKDASGDEE